MSSNNPMTPETRHNAVVKFMNSRFGGGDRAIYKGKEYPVASVDFEEQLIAIPSPYEGCDEGELQWVRCENVKIKHAHEIKTVSGQLEINVWVNCPHCDFYINLMDTNDTNDHDHNEEGQILKQACPDGHWSDSHEVFEIEDVECGECKKPFNVKTMEW